MVRLYTLNVHYGFPPINRRFRSIVPFARDLNALIVAMPVGLSASTNRQLSSLPQCASSLRRVAVVHEMLDLLVFKRLWLVIGSYTLLESQADLRHICSALCTVTSSRCLSCVPVLPRSGGSLMYNKSLGNNGVIR